MKEKFKKIFIVLGVCFISKAMAVPETNYGPTFVIGVTSWLDEYQTETIVPSIVYDDSIIRVSLFAAHKPFFNGLLHHTFGSCDNVPDNKWGMVIQNVLSIPRSFESNGVRFDYIGYEGDVEQRIDMYDGSIGLMSQSNGDAYTCLEYLDMVGKGELKNWYGSGNKVIALYKVNKLPELGERSYAVPVKSYFMRVARGSLWQDMASLGGYSNDRSVNFRMNITASCVVETLSLNLDHGILTPELIHNNEVSRKIVFQCSGGGRGNAKLFLSNHLQQNEIMLADNIKSQLSLSSDSVFIDRDERKEVMITSRLISNGDVTAGKFEGNDVLTVLWQ